MKAISRIILSSIFATMPLVGALAASSTNVLPGLSGAPSVSANGRWIAFMSSAGESFTERSFQIYLRNLETGQTTLVSGAVDGRPGNRDSFNPIVSPDGRHVIFESFSDNLVSGDNNGTRDVLIRDVENSSTTLISASVSNAESANAASLNPVLTQDGRFVVFQSFATDLNALPIGGLLDIYRYEIETGLIEFVSKPFGGIPESAHHTRSHSTSDDGSLIVFARDRSEITMETTFTLPAAYLWNATTGELTSIPASDDTGTYTRIFNMAISGDGTAIFMEGPWLAEGDAEPSRAIVRIDQATSERHVIASALDLTGPYGQFSGDNGIELHPTSSGDELVALIHDVPKQRAIYWNTFLPLAELITSNHIITDIAHDPFDGSFVFTGRPISEPEIMESPRQTLLYRYNASTKELVELPLTGEDEGSYQTDGLAIADNGTIAFHTERNGIADGDTNNAFDVYTLSEESGLFDWISTAVVRARPVLNILAGSANGITLTWGVEIGRRYLVEYRNSINGDTWKALGDEEVADSDLMSANDSRDGETQRYYRVVDVTP